jgi:hypothetical protein
MVRPPQGACSSQVGHSRGPVKGPAVPSTAVSGPGGTEVVVVMPRRVVRGWAAAALLLLNALNAVNLATLDRGGWLLMAFEKNPSTWFASGVLALAAVLAWWAGRASGGSAGWNVVAALLALMSLDEVATLHEKLGGLPGPSGLASRSWIGAGVLLVLAVAAYLLPWLSSLPRHLQLAFVHAAGLFLAGAVGVEWLAGSWADVHGEDRAFFVISTVEENLELLGALVLVDRLMGHLAARGDTMRFQPEDGVRVR